MSETITPAPAADPAPAAAATPVVGMPTTDTTILSDAAPADPSVSRDATQAEPPKTEEPKPVVPEKYEFKAPEGQELDAAQIEAFSPVAKELGLTQDQAQKLVDLQAQFAKSQGEAMNVQIAKMHEGWQAEARTDKEYGGPQFEANVGLASKALDAYGTPALRKALNDTGMGNHPELIRAFVRVGKAMSEDKLVSGNAGGTGAPKTPAERLFPHLPPG